MSRRREHWESLGPATQAALREVRDLDAEHVRLSGIAPPAVLASIRHRRDQLVRRQETPVTFADLIAKEVERAGSQTALADELGVRQSRISAWLSGAVMPSVPRMREVVSQLGYNWDTIKGGLIEPAPRPVVTIAPRSLTVRIPSDLQALFGLEDEVPDRVRRLAWEAAAGAFQAVVRASNY